MHLQSDGAGSDDGIAIAETLLRDNDLRDSGLYVRQARLDGRALAWIEPTRDLTLVKLHGTGLHKVGQNSGWLVTADESQYVYTRAWGYAIRDWVPDADGFVWRSKRNNDGFAYVFFDDRCKPNPFVPTTHPGFEPDTGLPLSGPGFAGRPLAYFKQLLGVFGYEIGPSPS